MCPLWERGKQLSWLVCPNRLDNSAEGAHIYHRPYPLVTLPSFDILLNPQVWFRLKGRLT